MLRIWEIFQPAPPLGAAGWVGAENVGPAMFTGTTIVNLDAIRNAPLSNAPYPFFLGSGFLRPDFIDALQRDFPAITKPGFLTVAPEKLKGRFGILIEELEGPAVTGVLSEKFGLDLHPFPRLTTIRKFSQARDGRPHTDGESKVMTILVYFNDDWPAGGAGRLRSCRGRMISTTWRRRCRRPRARSSASCGATIPGTGICRSPASGGSCRSRGCATQRNSRARRNAMRSPRC